MIVIGAGVIGVELGSVWSRLGSEVRFIFTMLKETNLKKDLTSFDVTNVVLFPN